MTREQTEKLLGWLTSAFPGSRFVPSAADTWHRTLAQYPVDQVREACRKLERGSDQYAPALPVFRSLVVNCADREWKPPKATKKSAGLAGITRQAERLLDMAQEYAVAERSQDDGKMQGLRAEWQAMADAGQIAAPDGRSAKWWETRYGVVNVRIEIGG